MANNLLSENGGSRPLFLSRCRESPIYPGALAAPLFPKRPRLGERSCRQGNSSFRPARGVGIRRITQSPGRQVHQPINRREECRARVSPDPVGAKSSVERDR